MRVVINRIRFAFNGDRSGWIPEGYTVTEVTKYCKKFDSMECINKGVAFFLTWHIICSTFFFSARETTFHGMLAVLDGLEIYYVVEATKEDVIGTILGFHDHQGPRWRNACDDGSG